MNLNFLLLSLLILFIFIVILNSEKISSFFFSKKIRKKFRYVCPHCASSNLKSIFIMSPVEYGRPGAKKYMERNKRFPFLALYFFGWLPQNPQVYICKDCDYYGICPEVEEDKIEEFKKKIKEAKEI